MSGGSHDYVFCKIANALSIPSGHYGIGDGCYYEDDIKYCRKLNPMHDQELSELMYDVSCLLHSLEWYESSDTGEDTYMKDVTAFKEKWFGRNSEQSINKYREDVMTFLFEIEKSVMNGGSDA